MVQTGKILNIKDAYSHPLFYRGVDDSTGFKTRSILCFPIKDERGEFSSSSTSFDGNPSWSNQWVLIVNKCPSLRFISYKYSIGDLGRLTYQSFHGNIITPKVYLSITKVSFITDNIIGAAQLCNKIGSPYFTSIDEDIARALATYCCISIVHVS